MEAPSKRTSRDGRMIPRAYITAWRKIAPWSTDAQIEQDLILSRALVEIFSQPILSSQLAFRGGTALHKLFLTPASRYSEDIDLVQVKPEGSRPQRSISPIDLRNPFRDGLSVNLIGVYRIF